MSHQNGYTLAKRPKLELEKRSEDIVQMFQFEDVKCLVDVVVLMLIVPFGPIVIPSAYDTIKAYDNLHIVESQRIGNVFN